MPDFAFLRVFGVNFSCNTGPCCLFSSRDSSPDPSKVMINVVPLLLELVLFWELTGSKLHSSSQFSLHSGRSIGTYGGLSCEVVPLTGVVSSARFSEQGESVTGTY